MKMTAATLGSDSESAGPAPLGGCCGSLEGRQGCLLMKPMPGGLLQLCPGRALLPAWASGGRQMGSHPTAAGTSVFIFLSLSFPISKKEEKSYQTKRLAVGITIKYGSRSTYRQARHPQHQTEGTLCFCCPHSLCSPAEHPGSLLASSATHTCPSHPSHLFFINSLQGPRVTFCTQR